MARAAFSRPGTPTVAAQVATRAVAHVARAAATLAAAAAVLIPAAVPIPAAVLIPAAATLAAAAAVPTPAAVATPVAHLFFARAHVAEGAGVAGSKLSEEYELAPRFVVGFENGCGQGARIRYWHYGHHSDDITSPLGVRFEWDVVDFEVTNRFQGCRTDVTLAGGVRWAGTGITTANNTADADLIGLTAAVDVETLICCDCCNYWSWVYGGRLAILGGDWNGRPNAFIPVTPTRDDNVVVTELYMGVEYGCCYCGNDYFTRLAFEIQNWHSDVASQAANTDSIGFVGPAWHVGMGW